MVQLSRYGLYADSLRHRTCQSVERIPDQVIQIDTLSAEGGLPDLPRDEDIHIQKTVPDNGKSHQGASDHMDNRLRWECVREDSRIE